MVAINALISFFLQSFRCGAPLLLGTTGEITNQKSGCMNLGVEGMMSVGAIGGYILGATTQSLLLAIIGAFVCGGLCGLLYCLLTVVFQANQNVTGLSITIFGVALCNFVGLTLQSSDKWVDMSSSMLKWFRTGTLIEMENFSLWGVIHNLFLSSNFFVYFAIIVAVIMAVFFSRTKSGLKVRAIGENPAAADGVGINITTTKFAINFVGSGICGIGGLVTATTVQSGFNENWMLGYGWVAIALVIFANWSTSKAILGSFIFGALMALETRIQVLVMAMPDLLGWMNSIPVYFIKALPYLMTAIIIIISSIRKNNKSGEPKSVGVNYYREER